MLLIYVHKNSSRISYVFDLLFKGELMVNYAITTDPVAFKNYTQPKINYSTQQFADGFFIKAESLLHENFIEKKQMIVSEKYGTKVLFPNDEICDLGFDIFAAIFYMVSRYEEYLPFVPDKYGRFNAVESLAFQHNFLQLPVVNQWIDIFKNRLQKKFPALSVTATKFNALITYDIDVAYKFEGRNFARTIGSATKDLLKFNFRNFKSRLSVFFKNAPDPWDVYGYLSRVLSINKIDSLFFFLLADRSEYDRNLDYRHPIMNELIKDVSRFSEIGIHPSFYSSSVPEKIVVEKERLEKISGKTITKSRQHFLKFNLPDTYLSLLNAGITEDYSMAFAGANGFRAGTCKPFYFYDLKHEQSTTLKIFPVACMDATFIYYSRQSPEKSLLEILNLLKEVKKVEGNFISIWHNENLGEAKENKKWNQVHQSMMMQVKAYLKK